MGSRTPSSQHPTAPDSWSMRPTSENGEHGHLLIVDADGSDIRRLNPEGTLVPRLPSTGEPGIVLARLEAGGVRRLRGGTGQHLGSGAQCRLRRRRREREAQRIGSLGTGDRGGALVTDR